MCKQQAGKDLCWPRLVCIAIYREAVCRRFSRSHQPCTLRQPPGIRSRRTHYRDYTMTGACSVWLTWSSTHGIWGGPVEAGHIGVLVSSIDAPRGDKCMESGRRAASNLTCCRRRALPALHVVSTCLAKNNKNVKNEAPVACLAA